MDLKSAYKQVPSCFKQIGLTVVAVWSPKHQRVMFFIAYCQLFGGKSPPLNFARFPAWMCEVNAVLFGAPTSHCVDDIISVEPESLAAAGNMAFKSLCLLTGWAISEEKSPEPAYSFIVIGVQLDLSLVPEGEAAIRVTEKRIEQLDLILRKIRDDDRLGSGDAAQVTGKLGFTLCACFGRYGRAKLRPLIRRCGERHVKLNPQLLEAIEFWLRFLVTYKPRYIPVFYETRDITVSYSDGEGSKAGLGIAVWSTLQQKPFAAFCEIPEEIRELWDKQRAKEEERRDIFLIEAIGPLSILRTFPNIMRNSIWLHFIDNEGAQHSLVKGSSSIEAGDVVVGETWEWIQRLNVIPYFDRVESEANPVDGLSRGRPEGPWTQVDRALLPDGLIEKLRKCRVSEGPDACL
jgi:hypothetical protein